MADKKLIRKEKSQNQASSRRTSDSNLTFLAAKNKPPRGALTVTVSSSPARSNAIKMPNGSGGAMPDQRQFPRVREWAAGLSPNPAEKMEQAWHGIRPGTFVGNFGDRKTPRPLNNPWKPTGFTGDGSMGIPTGGSTAV